MNLPIAPELLAQLRHLSSQQLAFLAGYAWAKSEGEVSAASTTTALEKTISASTSTNARCVTVVSASQTGNSRKVALQLTSKLEGAGVKVKHIPAIDYKNKQLVEEDIFLLITSTQGEGEAPEEAVSLYKYLSGKKAPSLTQLHFAVLGLGDSSYPAFCQAGKDFDALLAKCGATRLTDVGLCDLDFQATADGWTDELVRLVAQVAQQGGATQAATTSTTASEAFAPSIYDKDNPFDATLSVRQKITSRDAEKDVEHIEIDLQGSGIRYQPGDALGVWPVNDITVVEEILHLTKADGDELVEGKSLRDILMLERDITQSTPQFIQQYAALNPNDELQLLLADKAALSHYLAQTPPTGILTEFPAKLSATEVAALFRAQTPRLYSIASSQDEVGEEVHLTVGVVRYEHHGEHYLGATSGFIGTRLEEGETLRVFVATNPLFRLPEQGDVPIIMIGAGTGIAPFRAFMQQREYNGDNGDNWLFFGNQKFTDDFLYQSEWLQYRKSGLLTRADLAWSRQGSEKVYVQHKLIENRHDVWQWLQHGAYVYVCGDAKRMAHDVEQALLDIIATEGAMPRDDAEDYLNDLRENRRYQRDVY
ncbi:MAG: assimilatory sulfite reductase (NADPH) flavoprotein subunit [Cardiobacteriaceae bacterium]|nr:assimilatory sulfite reductase (NADPH) flavoprotein subunit [Cardiobacteriaceae bacterium]